MRMLTVSQLNRYVKAVLEEDKKLGSLFLTGEISNFTHHYSSGHFYFTLGDGEASVRAVMFKRYASEASFLPEDGMEVVVRASVSLYERDGSFQIYVTDIIPGGEGAAAVGFRQLKERLAKLGVFDPESKKTLPRYPEKIGVITSESGAALADILRVMESRCPMARVLFAPALVQGAGASASLISAIDLLDRNCDIIIIGRGGGSSEDLAAFNDEALAMRLFRAETPVISAVGHEVDTTICDLAADLRAPTPSAAAEIAVPSARELISHIEALNKRLKITADRHIREQSRRFETVSRERVLKNPSEFVKIQRERLFFLRESLYNKKDTFFAKKANELYRQAALLESLSPLSVLARGYGVIRAGDRAVMSVKGIAPGDSVTILLRDGSAEATVNIVDELENGRNDCEDIFRGARRRT